MYVIFKQGNVQFIPDEKQHDQARVKNNEAVANIAKLLASSQDEVEKALCYRVVAARGEVVEKGHSVKDAMYARDAFAKVLCFSVITDYETSAQLYPDWSSLSSSNLICSGIRSSFFLVHFNHIMLCL